MRSWVRLQEDLYQHFKRELRLHLQPKSKVFLDYERRFRSDQKYLQIGSRENFVKQMKSADFVFIGDFHTLKQSQKLVLRLLKDRQIKKPKTIGFEVLSDDILPTLNTFLKFPHRKQNEQNLKNALQLGPTWGSHFDVYREIFIRCHQLKIQILPLKTESQNLHEQDQDCARKLALLSGCTWVLYGEFHCSRSHLPFQLALKLRHESRSIVTVQQNDDHASLRYLTKLQPEKTLVLEAPPRRFPGLKQSLPLFCILHTPLWVKYQSYLERQILAEEESGGDGIDPHDQIAWSLRTLMEFLRDSRYPTPSRLENLNDFEVFTPSDDTFSRSLSRLPTRTRSWVLKQLEATKVAALPAHRRIYLAEVTVNSCAHGAGLYLYLSWSSLDLQKATFFERTLAEALAFFLSKVLNHSRRTKHWKQWTWLSRSREDQSRADAILKARKFSTQFSSRTSWLKEMRGFQTEASTALARILGDSAFEAFLGGELSLQRILRLISQKPRSELEAFEVLVELKSVSRAFDRPGEKNW